MQRIAAQRPRPAVSTQRVSMANMQVLIHLNTLGRFVDSGGVGL
jgi:hypothetical protein